MYMNSKIISRTEIGMKSYPIFIVSMNSIKTEKLIKGYYLLQISRKRNV